jgi:glycosyltransferase involved in cell wall biosynthesis
MFTNLPMISVIIPARNEEGFIGDTISMLLRQDYPSDRMEVIVVDGMSDDRTPEIVKEVSAVDSRVRFFENPHRLSSGARNIGAKNARGEIITYIDAHVHIDNDQLLKNTALLMRSHNLDVLSRPQFLDTPGITPFQDAVALARKAHLGHGLDSTIYLSEDKYVEPYSSGASYTKKVFETIGYFDEAFDAAEDAEFNYRCGKAGFRSFTSMKLAVHYYPRETLQGLFRQMKRYGTGRMRLYRKHKAGVASGPFFLLFLLFFYCSLIIGSLLYTPLWYGVIGATFLYCFGCILDCALLDLRRTIRHSWRLLPVFLCVHSGLVWGLVVEAIQGRRLFKDINK